MNEIYCSMYGQINPESDKRQDKFVFQLGDMAIFDTLDPIRQAIHFCLFSKTNKNCCYCPLNWMLRYPRLPYPLPPNSSPAFSSSYPFKISPHEFISSRENLIEKGFFFLEIKRLVSSLQKITVEQKPKNTFSCRLKSNGYFSCFRLKCLWCILPLGCLATLRRRSVFSE